jgi:copper chaperone CopZ
MSEPTTLRRSVHQVAGMTCGHCVRAIQEEVCAIDGVTDAHVDLTTGDLTVVATRPVSAQELAAAVDEAGYQLVR